MFSTLRKSFNSFVRLSDLLSVDAFNLDESKICHLVKIDLTLSSMHTHCNTLKKKVIKKTLWKKVKLLKMSNFTFFHNVFYAISILKYFNSHTPVVLCSFFEFGTV